MIIFLRIYKYYANLWVINVLTIKMFFATDRVVKVTGEDKSKRKNEKIQDFTAKELLGIRIIE